MFRVIGPDHTTLAPQSDAGQTGERIVETGAEARQGPKGRPVLIVLLGSLVLLSIYLASMVIWSLVAAPIAPREAAREPPVLPSSALNAPDAPAANPAYPVPAVPYVK